MQYRRSLLTYSLISFLCLGVGYGWLGTYSGLILTIKGAQSVLSGRLSITGVKGCLMGPIQFDRLVYDDQSYHLDISNIHFDWKKRAFLQGRCCVRTLTVQAIHIDSKSTQEKTALPQMPAGLSRLSVLYVDIKALVFKSNNLKIEASGRFGRHSQFNWRLRYTPSDPAGKVGQPLLLEGHLNGSGLKKPDLLIEGYSVHPFRWDWSTQQEGQNNVYTIAVPRVHFKGTYHDNQWNMQGWLQRDDRHTANGVSLMVHLPHYTFKPLYNPRQSIQASVQLNVCDWKQLAKMGVPLDVFGVDAQSGALNMTGHVETTLRYLKRCVKRPEKYLFKHRWFNPLGTVPLTGHATVLWHNPILTEWGMHLKKASIKGDFAHDAIQWRAQLIEKPNKKRGSLPLAQWTLQGSTRLEWRGLNTKMSTSPIRMDTRLQLTGDPLPLFTHTQYQFSAAPRLTIHHSADQFLMSGKIHIPRARLNFQYSDTTISLDKDIEFVHDTVSKKQPFVLPFKVDINLQLGKDVYCYYAGLNARVEGGLQLVQHHGSALSARGEIKLVEGHYYYCGQDLKVEPHSRLIFTEWLYNPKIDIEASRSIYIKPSQTMLPVTPLQDMGLRTRTPILQPKIEARLPMRLKVGVRVRGDIEEPYMNLFSTPPGWVTDPADNLSYILTGQPVSRLNTAAMPLLLNALAQMGAGYMNYHGTGAYIKNTFGLEWDIESEQLTTKTHLIISKKLNPKLSVGCKLGLRNPDRIVKASYLVNPSLLIEGSKSNVATGIDLIYQKETG